jgi:hypothetical protein
MARACGIDYEQAAREGGIQTVDVEGTPVHRRIALKVLPPELAADREHLERFRREACAVAAINIAVGVHAHGGQIHGDGKSNPGSRHDHPSSFAERAEVAPDYKALSSGSTDDDLGQAP